MVGHGGALLSLRPCPPPLYPLATARLPHTPPALPPSPALCGSAAAAPAASAPDGSRSGSEMEPKKLHDRRSGEGGQRGSSLRTLDPRPAQPPSWSSREDVSLARAALPRATALYFPWLACLLRRHFVLQCAAATGDIHELTPALSIPTFSSRRRSKELRRS